MQFIHEYLDIGPETSKYIELIKTQMFELLEVEMNKRDHFKRKDTLLPLLRKTMEDTMELRNQMQLDQSSKLIQAEEEAWLKTAETGELITHFLKNLNLEETRGALKMALALSADNTLKVELLNVNNLKPRNNRSSLDFSITITKCPLRIHYYIMSFMWQSVIDTLKEERSSLDLRNQMQLDKSSKLIQQAEEEHNF